MIYKETTWTTGDGLVMMSKRGPGLYINATAIEDKDVTDLIKALTEYMEAKK